MKKNILQTLFVLSLTLITSVPTFAANTALIPSKNTMYIHAGTTTDIVENIPAYLYKDNNYFKLRDLGKLFGYAVTWNENTKCIEMVKDDSKKDLSGVKPPASAASVVENAETIIIDSTEYSNAQCINIDGYNYFKLRNLTDLMNFKCDWDATNNAVIITFSDSTELDAILQPFVNEELNQLMITDSTATYVPGSYDYQNIERFMKNNIDSTFDLDNYIVKEDTAYQGMGVSVLDIRYSVNDLPTLNFGYRIVCANGRAQIINFIGEKNNDFDTSKITLPTLTDEELKQMALALDNLSYQVDEQSITRYFDMDDLVFKCQVDTVYIDNSGAYFALGHEFNI